MNGHAYYVMDRRQQRVFLYPPRGRIHGDSCPRRSRESSRREAPRGARSSKIRYPLHDPPPLLPTIERYNASIDARRIECLEAGP